MLEFIKTEVLKSLDRISDGHTAAVIIAAAAILAVHITVCAIMASSAKRKGHSGFGFFVLCLFTGVIGYCITASLSDLKMYELINEILDRLDDTDNITYTDKAIAQTNDERAPEGVVAYIPTPKNSDTSAQEAAADRIEQFWKKNNDDSDDTDFTDEKKERKAAARREKEQKQAQKAAEREEKSRKAELEKLNKKRNKRMEAQKQRADAQNNAADDTKSADA